MTTKRASKQLTSVHQLKVTLKDTQPPIWRRIVVPSDFTLAELHDVLQETMGWHHSHLHDFRIGKVTYGDPAMLQELQTRMSGKHAWWRSHRSPRSASSTRTTSATTGSLTFWLRPWDHLNRGPTTRHVSRANAPAHPMTAAGFGATPTWWRPWPTPTVPIVRSWKSSWNGWMSRSIQRRSIRRRSTNGCGDTSVERTLLQVNWR